jgi:hypothetical protein
LSKVFWSELLEHVRYVLAAVEHKRTSRTLPDKLIEHSIGNVQCVFILAAVPEAAQAQRGGSAGRIDQPCPKVAVRYRDISATEKVLNQMGID